MIDFKQLTLHEFLDEIQQLTDIAIVGGYLRDKYPKDIDIIMLDDVQFDKSVRNRFGGFKLKLKDNTVVDIWCVKHHHSVLSTPVSFENIIEHLLLNVMGCIYYPKTGKVDRTYLDECMNKKEIDFIVYNERAIKQVSLVKEKIKRLQDMYGLTLSKRLQEVIEGL